MKRTSFLAVIATAMVALATVPPALAEPPTNPVVHYRQSLVQATENLEAALTGSYAQLLLEVYRATHDFARSTEAHYAQAVADSRPKEYLDGIIDQYVLALNHIGGNYQDASRFLSQQAQVLAQKQQGFSLDIRRQSVPGGFLIALSQRGETAIKNYAARFAASERIVQDIKTQMNARVRARLAKGEKNPNRIAQEEIRSVAKTILDQKMAGGIDH